MNKRTSASPRLKNGLYRVPAVRRAVKPVDKTHVDEDIELLRRAIKKTKLLQQDFAEMHLHCHERTLRKYLAGRALPALAREKCLELVRPVPRKKPKPTRVR